MRVTISNALVVIRINTSFYNNSYYSLGFVDGLADIRDNLDISYTYHEHRDSLGNIQSADYQSDTEGGCFTKKNEITETYTFVCNGIYNILRTSDGGHPGSAGKYDCSNHCGNYGNKNTVCKAVRTGTRVVQTYYTLDCGKTNDTIESAIIQFW